MASPTGYGYMGYYKPPRQPSLAQAASAKDPYGLAPNNRPGPLGIGASSSGFASPDPATRQPAYTRAQVDASTAANPHAAGANGSLFAYQGPPLSSQPPTASGVNHYDINTDPALQQITALLGQSDEQAQASALKQRQNLLLQYGDPTIAAAVLGAGDPLVQAASQNPTSTVAQLGQQKDRNMKSLLDELNQANLAYSGYRVTQEQQAAQDYQNALAQAAAGLNTNLDTVGSNLTAALGQNKMQRAQALADAAARHANDTTDPGATDASGAPSGGSTPPTPPTPPTSSGGGGYSVGDTVPSLVAALAAAAYQKQRRQAFAEDGTPYSNLGFPIYNN